MAAELGGIVRNVTAMLMVVAFAILGSALLAFGADPAPPAAKGPPSGYDLVPAFADEFDATALDTRIWGRTFAPRSLRDVPLERRSLYGNGERQVYFDRDYLRLGIEPLRIADGVLTITAAPLDARAKAAVAAALGRSPAEFHASALGRVAYSSGLVTTRDRFAQKFGYFEIRARWSGGKGIWPAFWLLPQDGSWPPEIDVLEAHGDKPGKAFHSIHSTLPPKARTRITDLAQPGQQFHRYGMLWLPDRVDYYVDGRKTATLPAPADLARQPMYLIANLAIGGHWPGDPDASTRFPATMAIDYIRVWRFRTPPDAER